MFNWFRSPAQCPVEPATREWLEDRTAWLAEEFGLARIRTTPVVLPTAEFFPDTYNRSAEDVRHMLDRVCGFMGLEPETVELALFQDRHPFPGDGWRHGASGLYHEEDGKYHVAIEASNLDDPLALVATMAHELGHVHLLGHGRVAPETEDQEWLTDLLTVFLGMGVFTANAVIRESYWHAGEVSGWKMKRSGYLTMPMYGYAFALFAWMRGEEQPAWARHLRLDVRSAFKQGCRYLLESGDAAFNPTG